MTVPAKRIKFGLSDVIGGNLRSLPKSSMNKELDGFKSDYAFQKIRLETSTVSTITEFIGRHQLCIPSFLTAVWSVLHSHYVNHNEVAVWHSVISDVAEDTGNQCDPLLIHIQNDDQFYDLVHKINTQMDHGKREGGARIETFTQAETCSTDSMVSDGCFISGIVNTQWSPIGTNSSYEMNQPMIAFLYEYRLGELEYALQYNRRYLDEVQMYTIAGQFQVLLKSVLCDPEKPALSHPFLTAREGEQFIRWNDTARMFSKHKTVHQFVEEQAARTPEAVAVEFREQKLSYSELNRRANQIARTIIDLYRAKGQFAQLSTMPVTLFMDRSANVLPAMLGVMKAGGAYLPVDPTYPKERIRFILEDAQTQVILTTRQLAGKLKPIIRQISLEEPKLICIDECLAQHGVLDENVNVEVKSSDLAYVIYTSGSTGNPKGALIEHAGLVALIPYLIGKFGLTPNTRVTQFASISFDASVYEWIGTLSVGGTLVVLSDDELPPYSDISDMLEQKKIFM
ncbi:AMP-binding protein [Paenibacillus rhizoplanae]|uniref:AMP-binding protein n=1 Tax=Paenibacillus rhizoplanae TaxID=1917181 RepID=UPI003623C391